MEIDFESVFSCCLQYPASLIDIKNSLFAKNVNILHLQKALSHQICNLWQLIFDHVLGCFLSRFPPEIYDRCQEQRPEIPVF